MTGIAPDPEVEADETAAFLLPPMAARRGRRYVMPNAGGMPATSTKRKDAAPAREVAGAGPSKADSSPRVGVAG